MKPVTKMPADELRLYELFVRYWDQSLSSTESEELAKRLASDVTARDWFQSFTMQAVAAR